MFMNLGEEKVDRHNIPVDLKDLQKDSKTT